MTERLQDADKKVVLARKGCPYRRGERTCIRSGETYCFPEELTKTELEELITQCAQGTTRGDSQRLPLRRGSYR